MDVVRTILSLIFPPRTEETLVASITDDVLQSLVLPKDIYSCTTLTDYTDERIRALVWEAKYQANTSAHERIGSVLAQHITTIEHDFVIPIPLSPQRRASRGYNQVEVALRAGHISQIETDVLIRVRDTVPQTHLPRSRRLTNLVGAFAVPDAARVKVRGARIVLVDDVCTTGTTLEEARRVLMRAGAARVHCLAFARS